MNNETVAPTGTVAIEPASTTLTHGTVDISGGGAPKLSQDKPDAKEGSSLRDILTNEAKRINEEDAKDTDEVKAKADDAAKDAKAKLDEKADKDAKAEKPKEEVKAEAKTGDETKEPAKAEKSEPEKAATGQEGADKSRPSEGQKYSEAPARFLPKAKEAWVNVPNAVKADFHRISQEYEQETAQYKASHERYEQIRQFDEVARSNGRDLKESLSKVMEVEQAIARNPLAGLESVLREVGPRKADGSHLSLYEVAQHVARMSPQEFYQALGGHMGQNPPPQQQAQPQQPSPEIEELRKELNQMKTAQVEQNILAPFMAEHPRFSELQDDIVFFLQSGKIPASLSPTERLEAAYDMAERINPRSVSAPQVEEPRSAAADPVPSDAGTKSIRGAPNGGEDPPAREKKQSVRDMLRTELRTMRA